ncbi:hypothetical protein L2E82_49194 [Cichorium intybus]|uniref:Uncharacterized protein n=1 Tax=Cichorium intybus TaxID=13427 RepID=A0ACB8YZX6_CICIN|nr:hypothetical protein L2E82_49194 [Cichorium intybus]
MFIFFCLQQHLHSHQLSQTCSDFIAGRSWTRLANQLQPPDESRSDSDWLCFGSRSLPPDESRSASDRLCFGSRSALVFKSGQQVGLQKISSLLESEDPNVRLHAVKVVANLAAEGHLILFLENRKYYYDLNMEKKSRSFDSRNGYNTNGYNGNSYDRYNPN